MNAQQQRPGHTARVRVIGGHETFTTTSPKPLDAGGILFLALMALITGAARLMLALLERLVTDLGGSSLYCDTDSMGIIASEMGGYLDCPGGKFRGPDGQEQIRVLTWQQVRDVVARFEALNPYQSTAAETLLKIEANQFSRAAGNSPKLSPTIRARGFPRSAYCVFRIRENGHLRFYQAFPNMAWITLLNPQDPEDRQKGLCAVRPRGFQEVWRNLVETARGGKPAKLPAWFSRPAVARHALTTPQLWRAMARRENGLTYAKASKPFNFCISCVVAPGGNPAGTDPAANSPFDCTL